MRNTLILAGLVVIAATSAAGATDQMRNNARGNVQQIRTEIDKLGYNVDRLKLDGGAYEVQLTDRESGGKLSAIFDANTGELMQAKPARENRKVDERENARDQKETREHKGDKPH